MNQRQPSADHSELDRLLSVGVARSLLVPNRKTLPLLPELLQSHLRITDDMDVQRAEADAVGASPVERVWLRCHGSRAKGMNE